MTPTGPHGVDVHTFSDIDDQIDVGVVVVIRASGNLEFLSADMLTHGEETLVAQHDHAPQHIDPPYGCSRHLRADLLAWPSL